MQLLKLLIRIPCTLIFAAGLTLVHTATAGDISLSGFGTIGYAKSDQKFNYLRHINESGTFIHDSILGAQMDASFNPEWSATIQAKLAPTLKVDNRFEPSISWAFLAYRPNNDLLIRAGKLRMPFYLRAENMDVGATYTATRLPNEVYSVSPTMDFNGASFVKTWTVGENEWNLDGYWGRTTTPWRSYDRDTATPYWLNLNIEARGLLLSFHLKENIFRAGFHSAELTREDNKSYVADLAAVTMNPLSGISGTYYVPSSEQVFKITAPAFNFGMDVKLGQDYRAAGEYVRRMVKGINTGPDSESYFLSLMKEVDRWTPYLTYARIKSRNLGIYQTVNNARVTSTGAPAAVIDGINATQRDAADNMNMYDQYSWAIGTSYNIDAKSKIKAEWQIVNTGLASSFIDAPVGEESGNRRINVYSLSYNFVF